MSHVPARTAAAALALATGLALAPAAQTSGNAAFVVVGPFIKLTPKGGVLMLVKGGNAAGKAFVGHRVVFPIDKSKFAVPDRNGDGEQDARDFQKGDRIKATKKVVPPGPSGDDPQKLGPAKLWLYTPPSSG